MTRLDTGGDRQTQLYNPSAIANNVRKAVSNVAQAQSFYNPASIAANARNAYHSVADAQSFYNPASIASNVKNAYHSVAAAQPQQQQPVYQAPTGPSQEQIDAAQARHRAELQTMHNASIAREIASGARADPAVVRQQQIAAANARHQAELSAMHDASIAREIASGARADPNAPAMRAAAVEPAPPQTVDVPDPEADPTYKSQHADYQQALADYTGDQNLAASQFDTGHNDGLRKLGWGAHGWNSGDATQAYGNAFQNNQEDFASRGAYNSGVYGKSVDQINNNFNDQKTDLDTSQTDFHNTQHRALNNYRNTNNQQDHEALLAAIGRIAQKYNVDPSQVVAGSGGTKVPVGP